MLSASHRRLTRRGGAGSQRCLSGAALMLRGVTCVQMAALMACLWPPAPHQARAAPR
jgi:hypothetical protein